jgi:glycosyltransferase involved in cell wall biosynthesis
LAFGIHSAFGLDERLVDRLIAPSQFVKDKFAEWKRNAFKIDVVPHFIDASRYQPDYVPGEEAVYAGRLSEEKGIGALIAAMEKIPEVRLKVIGTGPMEKQLKDFCRLANLGNVRFLGQLDHQATMKEISKSRFVVVPSLSYETFGYPVIEAYALGKAVVASRIGALAENVIDGQTGLLVRPGDAKDLAATLAKLSSNEPLLRAMGKEGRHICEQKYRPEDHYLRLMDVYDSVREAKGLAN